MNGSAAFPTVSRAWSPPWLVDSRWDLFWLIGSSAIVPLVLLFVWAGISNDALNLTVTVLIGGPHLLATYTATYLDPRFRRDHRWMLALAGLFIPAFVVAGVLADFQVLLSAFIFLASVHVLQQNAYLADVYRRRAATTDSSWSRWIDYGVLGASFYPIASWKLVHGTFLLGDVSILIPAVLKTETTAWIAWIAFLTFAALWIGKTLAEARCGTLNLPKTLLIGVTALVAFLVPAAAGGARLELAFQSVNAWHSFQYLGLIWLVQKTRRDAGLIESPLIGRISGPGKPAAYFYGFCFAVTGTLLITLFGLSRWDPFRLDSFSKYYYMGVLSFLLIHYVLDTYLFAASGGRNAGRVPYGVIG
ncbi:MAG: hypothetical protein HY716_13405 [Planctomycetes bacterium]|nr:hypothetical protein [Planctomycetota bacterium]